MMRAAKILFKNDDALSTCTLDERAQLALAVAGYADDADDLTGADADRQIVQRVETSARTKTISAAFAGRARIRITGIR